MPKKVLSQLNILSQCRSYGLGLWQCPQFLFFVMGAVIIVAALISYMLGTRYIAEPSLVALIVIVITLILFIIAFVITRNFEKLAELSRLKSEFVNIVSHQLRAPITNLRWGVDFLMADDKEISEEKKEDYFSNFKENITRMVELVDDLVVVGRIEEGSFPSLKEEIDIEELVEEIVKRFRIFADASNVELYFSCQSNLPKLFMDRQQLKMVFENLVENGIRYTKKGRVEIRVERQGRYFRFQVKDTGVGIPKEDQKYIFQKFFRSKNVLKSQTRGSGLGLFVVKSIIDKAGGKIWFESQEGAGTTFYFTLPV